MSREDHLAATRECIRLAVENLKDLEKKLARLSRVVSGRLEIFEDTKGYLMTLDDGRCLSLMRLQKEDLQSLAKLLKRASEELV